MARVLSPGRAFYIWGGYANCANYPPVLKACELYFSQAIIWVKEHPVLTRKDFMGNHEWCFYGWREGAAHVFLGPNNAVDVWPIKKVNPQSMVHLTEKPVELAVRAMQYSSRAGENVLDLFGGSGSTLIAAQQTGRKAFLMEVDPLYCDVIVHRFEKFTALKAERIEGPRNDLPCQPVLASRSGRARATLPGCMQRRGVLAAGGSCGVLADRPRSRARGAWPPDRLVLLATLRPRTPGTLRRSDRADAEWLGGKRRGAGGNPEGA
jgi:DNA methylase